MYWLSDLWREAAQRLREEAAYAPHAISQRNALTLAEDCERCADELDERAATVVSERA